MEIRQTVAGTFQILPQKYNVTAEISMFPIIIGTIWNASKFQTTFYL